MRSAGAYFACAPLYYNNDATLYDPCAHVCIFICEAARPSNNLWRHVKRETRACKCEQMSELCGMEMMP
jgi:hypothetical protein